MCAVAVGMKLRAQVGSKYGALFRNYFYWKNNSFCLTLFL